MNRGIHALFALVALAVVVGLVVLWPHPDPLPPATAPDAPVPAPSGTTGRAPQPTAPATTVVPCPAPGPGHALSVLTFNIHGGLSHSGYDLEQVAREIEAWDADVVLLQEVDRHRLRTAFDDQPAWLAARLDMNVAFGRNVVRPPVTAEQRRQEYGTATLSRLPISSWRNVRLPNQPGLEPRGLLRVTVRAGGQPVNIYNTHLQHTRGNIRIVQLRAVRRIVARDPDPHVLGGDLNATPDSPALAVTAGLLRDPWTAVGGGPGLTVPAHVPRRRIDYVLHDEHWEPTSAETLRSSVSDHRALRVDLDLLRPRHCG